MAGTMNFAINDWRWGADILFGQSRSGLQRDKQTYILLAKGGRHPDGSRILYSLMGQRSLLDLET